MAANTFSPMATSSPMMAMNPTITEHDFRFPRRPYMAGATLKSTPGAGTAVAAHGAHSARAAAAPLGTAPPGAALPDFRLDMEATYGVAQEKLSRTDVFDNLRDGMAGAAQNPEEMRKEDPLATQVWRFFSKTKQSLPNQDRMENLTWRMMHMNLRKKQQEQQRARCVVSSAHPPARDTRLTCVARVPRPPAASSFSGPSGIAQLRKSSEQQNLLQPEPMNLDDFIDPENVATPAGLLATPSPDPGRPDLESSHSVTSAIPIKSSRRESAQSFGPQSVPVPPHQQTRGEFGYVTRHPRKTSIDERRVSDR